MSGSLTSAASILGTLFDVAAWRGVTFHMVDASEPTGRRLVKFLFPGRDDPDFADLGALDGDIRVTGLILGDDYQVRAGRMRQAFRAQGPAMLIHPWLGELRCLLTDPGQISFSDVEIGVARFTATFQRMPLPRPALVDTLGALLDKADAMLDAGQLLAEQLLAPLRLPLAMVLAVSSLFDQASGIWSGLLGNVPEDVSSAVSPALAALATPPATPAVNAGTTFADGAVATLGAVPAAIAGVIDTAPVSAVAPGGSGAPVSTVFGTNAAIAVDPRQVTTLLFSAAASFGGVASTAFANGNIPLAVLATIAQSQAIAQGAAAAGSIVYASQQDAEAWAATQDTAIATISAAVSALGPLAPQAATLWQSSRDLRAAVAADISSRLGRLPAVTTIVTGTTMSIWLIGLHVAGDTPATMVATMLDIVARNGIGNPAIVPPGLLEVLVPP